ncbi:MAG: tRNA epoxyqueuosine(34) reductase QueG [Bacteroidota bacterium]
MDKKHLSHFIKSEGSALGFDLVGISQATFLEEEASDLEQWLKRGMHGRMRYMENYFDKRLDPRLLVEGAQSVISVIHNYFPANPQTLPANKPKISRYAWGEDYHKVLKRKLYHLFQQIQEQVGREVNGRVFVDSAPVLDKAWARRSGLGWIGKHTNLITPQRGSYFFVGEIILDLPLAYDGPIKDYCGTCTRCIDACPTQALEPYQIDARKCLSYLTIELREEMDEQLAEQSEGWVYGCDICQEVCPWNRFTEPHSGDFTPYPHAAYTQVDWEEIDERTFKKLTRRTAMNRIKWEKMKHNLKIFRLWREKNDHKPAVGEDQIPSQ